MTKQAVIERALDIFQEFGPNRTIPVRQRWREAFPSATDDQLEQWEALFREMEHFAYGLGVRIVNGEIDEAAAAEMISKCYPRLASASIHRLISQACYFAMK